LFAIPENDQFEDRLLGANAKQLLLLFDAGDKVEELQSFLAKILQAIQLDLLRDALQLRLLPHESLQLAAVLHNRNCHVAIIFGHPLSQLGLHLELPLYYPTLHQGITYLLTDPLLDIQQERQNGGKKMSGALWSALREISIKL
jgi:hypothetical protein